MKRLVSPALLAVLAVLAPPGLLLLSGNAVAQTKTTYRWVDAQGVVHYSDTPQPGAQVIQLPSAQTYRAPPLPAAAPNSAASNAAPGRPLAPNDAASPYQSCGITEPATDASFFAPGSIAVAVQLAPGLRPGDQLTVTLDGSPLAPTAPGAASYQVPAPERGAHTLNAMVSDPDGKPACRAAPVTFYVQRPSMLSPASPVPKH
ncbi:MAG: DUF4124 domain-containing protein [Steroidobacterales bacterium]